MAIFKVQNDPDPASENSALLEHDTHAADAQSASSGAAPDHALCLDFTNTVSSRGADAETDRLADYADLLAWSVKHGVLDDLAAVPLRARAASDPAAARDVLARARALREAIYAIFAAHDAGGAPDAAALALFNRELARALAHLQLAPTAEQFAWQWAPAAETLDWPLWPVARAAADLLTSDDLARVRQCASPTCGWLFIDRSKNHSRRWCDMKECGNVAKVRRYRTRRKAEA